MKLDIQANRNAVKYSFAEKIKRILWTAVTPFYRLSPRPFFNWRNMVLRVFGAKIGKGVHIDNSAQIYFPWNFEIGNWSSIGESAFIYNLGKIRIGACSTISHRAHLCAGTHDYLRYDLPLEKPEIIIGDQVWICSDTFVGPGVHVGEGAVAGAGAVVIKSVDSWTVVGGNPATVLKKRVMKE